MEYFEVMQMLVEAADGGSLSAASRKLKIPLPTVSRKISELEAHLGVRLLIRTTRNIKLTEAGIGYVENSRRILEEVDDANKTAVGEYVSPKGRLVLTAPIASGRRIVLPIVHEFMRYFPDIKVQLILSDFHIRLVDEQVDMAIRVGHLPDSNLIATKLGSMREVVCGSPGYFTAHGVPRSLDDLDELSFVTHDLYAPATTLRFIDPATGLPLDKAINATLSVSIAEAAVDAALAGVGLTRVFLYQAYPAVATGDLRIVLEEFEPPPKPFNLVYAQRAQMPLKMRSFRDFAVPRMKQILATYSR